MNLMKMLFPSGDLETAGNKMKTTGLFCLALVAMIVNPVARIFNSYLNITLILFLAAVCFCGHRLLAVTENNSLTISAKGLFAVDRRAPKKYLWLLVLAATVMGYIKGAWGLGNLIDLVVVAIGVLMILDAPNSLSGYKIVLKIFVIFSLVYALGIWFEIFFPNAYKRYIDLMTYSGIPYKFFEDYYTGFTTNPQTTADYLALGIFALLPELPKKRPGTIAMLAFMLFTLLYTGVRMKILVIYALVVVMLYVLIPKKKWLKLTAVLCAVAVATWLATVFFPEQMYTIPIFKRLYMTAETLQIGEDVSSGRTALYQHAWKLFKKNPVFGIGWGNYRETVPGTVTLKTELDVHCIYLQVLCEVGVTGFLCYCPALFYTALKTLKEYFRRIRTEKKSLESKMLGFSLLYQAYFFSTGILDNTLYYLWSLIPYLISCGMLYAYLHSKSDMQQNRIINE